MYFNIFTTLMMNIESRFSIRGGGGSCEMWVLSNEGITNGLYFYCFSAGTLFRHPSERHTFTTFNRLLWFRLHFMEVYSQNKRLGCPGIKIIISRSWIYQVSVWKNGLLTVNGTVTLVLIITEVATIQFESKFMVLK